MVLRDRRRLRWLTSRVSRPGGRVVVGLNGADHLLGLRAALAEAGGVAKPGGRLRLEEGERLLRSAFSSVTRHDFIAPLRPPPAAVAAYVRSMTEAAQLPDSGPLVDRGLSLLYPNGPRTLSVTSHSGILVCA